MLTLAQAQHLRDRFRPERPGPLVGVHVLNTGYGACFVDRWPDPRAILADVAGNQSLLGDSAALSDHDLTSHVRGFVDAPDDFVPRLRAVFPELILWERVIYRLPGSPMVAHSGGAGVRRLTIADAAPVASLSADLLWIARSWGGPAGLAASGYACGAFIDGRLASVACSFFVGDRYEDIGVVTEPAYRRRGLSAAAAGLLCREVQARGRVPSWTTSTDNVASRGVAERLGFLVASAGRLYVIGVPLPS